MVMHRIQTSKVFWKKRNNYFSLNNTGTFVSFFIFYGFSVEETYLKIPSKPVKWNIKILCSFLRLFYSCPQSVQHFAIHTLLF